MVFVSCQFYLALFTVNSGSFSIFRSICLFLNFSENLGIFRVALLFICQRSISFVVVLFSAATLISYHNRFRLSTTFFDFFKSFSQPENLRFRGGVLYYHIASCFVNNFLHLFFKAFTQYRKWRKKRNLNLLRFFFYFLLVVNGERGI